MPEARRRLSGRIEEVTRPRSDPVFVIDDLDADIISLWRAEPRIGILEMSRRLGVARGTVQSRLDKMIDAGVIIGFGPDIDLSRIGYDVVGFTTIEVVQGRTDEVIEHLKTIPEVIEAHSIAGQGDILVRIRSRSNEQLMQVLQQILQSPAVDRASTALALANHIEHRTLPLIEEAAKGNT